MAPYLVTIGDSVHSGQGLRSAHKLHTLVARELRKAQPALVEHFMAHSGAIIGVGAAVSRKAVHIEVPVAHPTIIEQAVSFPGNPDDVLAVLVNGSINDVDIRTILNPIVPVAALADLIEEHCYDSVRQLLVTVAGAFPSPRTTIVMTPYYPVLSPRSRPFGIPLYLASEGLGLPPAVDLEVRNNIVVDRCMFFWKESDAAIARAVAAAASAHPRSRFVLADPGFTEANAMFADDPWLFGLRNEFGLPPEDDLAAERREACDVVIPASDFLGREQCYRASAGHPNEKGAGMYARAILRALAKPGQLGTTPPE